MRIGLLTSEEIRSSNSPLLCLKRSFFERGVESNLVSLQVNPEISLLGSHDVLIVRILKPEHLWLAQYLEEKGIPVINSYRALSLSSNKLISDTIMQQAGLKTPKTVFASKEKLLESADGPMFPALVKPLYGRSNGILHVESPDNLKKLRKRWIYLQKYIPNNDGVSRIYKVGDTVRSFYHPNEGKAQEVDLPKNLVEGALRCFHRMGMEIGGMDFIEGKDGYYALEVNDFPAGVKRIENWTEIVVEYVLKILARRAQERTLFDDLEKTMEYA